MFTVSEAWKKAYPGAVVGVLAMHDVVNPKVHAALDRRKEELERQLRARFSDYDRAALKALPTIQAYDDYYRAYKKTYHVQLQLESVVFKGKAIPRVAALVEAMFMAEIKNLLLTAGHDLEAVQGAVFVVAALGALPQVGEYVPTALLGWARSLMAGTGEPAWGAAGVSLAGIIVCLAAALAAFERQEL